MTDDTGEPQSPEPVKPDAGTPESGAKPPEGPDQKTRPKARRWPWVLAILILLFVAGIGTGLYFMPQLKDRAPFIARWLPAEDEGMDLTSFRNEITALEREVDRLNRAASVRDERIADLDAADARLATAIARVEALARTIDTTAAVNEAPPEPEVEAEPAPQADRDDDENRDRLAARLDMLMLRVGQIESAFVPLSEKVGRQEAAEDARARLQARTEDLDESITALDARLARLEQSASADAQQALLVLTYAAVRRAAADGRAFTNEIEALRELSETEARTGIRTDIRELATYADAPTPTISDLSARLPDRINDILEAARLPDDAGWWRKIWAKIQGLITLRPTGDVAGNDLEAVLARAETRMRFGDLEAAIGELETLTGRAAEAARPWLDDARRRIALDAALERLDEALRTIARQTGGPSENPPAATPAEPEREL